MTNLVIHANHEPVILIMQDANCEYLSAYALIKGAIGPHAPGPVLLAAAFVLTSRPERPAISL